MNVQLSPHLEADGKFGKHEAFTNAQTFRGREPGLMTSGKENRHFQLSIPKVMVGFEIIEIFFSCIATRTTPGIKPCNGFTGSLNPKGI